jgi:hypothetical protein
MSPLLQNLLIVAVMLGFAGIMGIAPLQNTVHAMPTTPS